MAEPDYYARWYNADIFSLQTSPRTTGDYSIQACEVEIKLPAGSSPDTLTYNMQMGIRFYDSKDATTFISTPEPEFDWYREDMTFSTELNEEPVYEEPQPKKQAEEEFTFAVEDIFTDKIAAFEQAQAEAAQAAADAAAAEEAAANADSTDTTTDSSSDTTAETQTNMIAGMRNKQETASAAYAASQTYSNGFTAYEGITANDYWTWTLALDMTEGLLGDDEVIYQWATLVDQSTENAFAPFTIGCKRTVGDDTTFHVDIFTQDSTTVQALYPDSADVTGVTWDVQAADSREEDSDVAWIADSSHHTLVGDSATSGNKIYACYIAEELSKIGRNPADFNRTFNVYLGARIYETATATDFITIPTAESSFDQGEPPAYDTGSSETGAFALFASGLAAIAVLFMAF